MADASYHVLAELFETAVGLPPKDRAAYVESVGAADPAIRNELYGLLGAFDVASDVIQESLRTTFTHHAAHRPESLPVNPYDLTGRTVSHFRIEELLGRGGMGVVYRARDTRLERTVALKFLPWTIHQDPIARERFLQEAKAASALDHPNIAVVHEVGHADEGYLFIAMSYYRGETLAARIARGPISCRDAVDYAHQAACGLAASHAQGIVHRDIKPGNLLVTEEGTVKILDFGLAKMSGVSVTETGLVVGTCAYMSPEQARGERADACTDVWSLGVVLYEMLTGMQPFSADYDVAVLYRILNEDPPPITEKILGFPHDLEKIVRKCLCKKREERYASMDSLLEDLDRVMRQQPVSDDHLLQPALPSPRNRGRTRVRDVSQAPHVITPRNKRPMYSEFTQKLQFQGSQISGGWWRDALSTLRWSRLAALLGVVLAAVLLWSAAAGMWGGSQPAVELIHLAVLPLDNIGGDPAAQPFIDGLIHTLSSKLAGTSQFQHRLSIVPTRDVLDANVSSTAGAREMFGVNLVIMGSLQKSGEEIRLTLDLVDATTGRILRPLILDERAVNLLDLENRVVLEVISQLEMELEPEARELLSAGATSVPGAYDAYIQGIGLLQRHENEDAVYLAVQHLERAVELDPEFVLAHVGLGEAYWIRFSHTFDPRWSTAARHHAETAVQLDGSVAPAWIALGLIYMGTADYGASERALQRAVDIDENSAHAHELLARAYELQGKYELAESEYGSAITLNPGGWSARNEWGIFLFNQARYAEAAEVFRQVIDLRPDNPWGYNNLALQLWRMGRLDEAAELLRKAAAVSPTADRATALALRNLADIHLIRGELAEARETLQHAVSMSDSDYAIWVGLARVYHWTGEAQKEEQAWLAAIGLLQNVVSVNPGDVFATANLALAYAGVDRSADARSSLDYLAELPQANRFAWTIAAEASVVMGDWKAAAAYLERALEAGQIRLDLQASPWLRELVHRPEVADFMAEQGGE